MRKVNYITTTELTPTINRDLLAAALTGSIDNDFLYKARKKR